MGPDFDRAERHARSLDGEDDSTRRAAEADPAPAPDSSSRETIEHAVEDHKVAGAVGAVTGAAAGTVLAGPGGTVIGAAAGAARGVVAGVVLDHVKDKLDGTDESHGGDEPGA